MNVSQDSIKGDILIVDDEPENLYLLEKILTKNGLQVRTADNGRYALESIKNNPPDLVLLDVKMPGMDGYEVCRQLKADPLTVNIPVIFLSALNDEESKVKGFEEGGIDYITKPFHLQEILARVRAHLSMGRMQQNLEEMVHERTSKLQAVTEHFQRIFELASDAFFIHDFVDGSIIDVNQQACKSLGYTREEIQKLKVPDIEAGLSQDQIIDMCNKAEKGQHVVTEGRHKRKDGSTFQVEVSRGLLQEQKPKLCLAIARDISDRKRAEEEIRVEREFTDTALDAQMDTFFLFDPTDGKALRWNRSFRDMSGYTDEEIAGMPAAPDSFFGFEELKRAEDFIQEVFEKGSGTIELDLIRKDGRRIPTEYRVSAVTDEEGEPKYLISIGRDITERRQAEKVLLENQSKFLGAFNLNPNPAGITTLKEGIFLDINEAFTRVLGFSKEDLVGRSSNVLKLYADSEDRSKMINLLKMNGFVNEYEITALTKSGTEIRGIMSATIFEINGEPHLFTTVQDITERKISEKKLQDSEERYRTLFEHSGTLMVIIDSSLKLVQANEKFKRSTGLRWEELENMNFKEFLPEGEIGRIKDFIDIKDKSQKVFPGTVQIRLINLKDIKIDVYLNINQVQETEQYLLSMIDITKVVQLENEILNITTKEQSRLGRDLHDNIGQTLTGLSFLAKSIEVKLKDENKELADDASELIDRISGLIDKTHYLSKGLNPVDLESNTLTGALKDFSHDIMNIYKVQVNIVTGKKIRINDKTILTHVYFIIKEAVNNAIKHGKATRVDVTLKTVRNRRLNIMVTDNGKGLSKKYKNKKGLGLMIMSNRARLINGTFNIEKNHETGGTTVNVSANLDL